MMTTKKTAAPKPATELSNEASPRLRALVAEARRRKQKIPTTEPDAPAPAFQDAPTEPVVVQEATPETPGEPIPPRPANKIKAERYARAKTMTDPEALALAEEHHATLRTQVVPPTITLAQIGQNFCDHLLAQGRTAATVGGYRQDFDLAVEFFGPLVNAEPEMLTPERILSFEHSDLVCLTKTGKIKSSLTTDKTKRVFRLAIAHARANGALLANPYNA